MSLNKIQNDEIFNYLLATNNLSAAYIKYAMPNITKHVGKILLDYHSGNLLPEALYSLIMDMVKSDILSSDDGIKCFLSYCWDIVNTESRSASICKEMIKVLYVNKSTILNHVLKSANVQMRNLIGTALKLYLLNYDEQKDWFYKSRARDTSIESVIFDTPGGEEHPSAVNSFDTYADMISSNGAILTVDPYFKKWSLKLSTLPRVSGSFAEVDGKIEASIEHVRQSDRVWKNKYELEDSIGPGNLNSFNEYIKPFLKLIIPSNDSYRLFILYDKEFSDYRDTGLPNDYNETTKLQIIKKTYVDL